MTEIKIGKAVLIPLMYIPNPQGFLSYQAFSELQSKLQYNQEWMDEAEKEIKRLNAHIKELRQESIETDKMLNMDTSALHKDIDTL
jgi:septation ring formation regulator EzrA